MAGEFIGRRAPRFKRKMNVEKKPQILTPVCTMPNIVSL
jgi:hypothetical protein